jgi:calcineurin-like phosphoesterase family protein
MVHEKFFISDHHLFHSNTWKLFKNASGLPMRPFSSNEEMHEYMVEKWNSVIKDQDNVYHLGDVTFDYGPRFNGLMSRLKGRKRLIVGNHDKIWNPNLMRWFEKADLWKGFSESNFTASHFPLRLESLRDGAFNVHGHTHANNMEDPRYINVSVEVRDYTPVHLDQITKEINERTT